MRMLHIFEEEDDAEILCDALYVDGVETSIRETRDDHFAIWVHDEERLSDAKALLAAFEANPDSDQFESRQRQAHAQRKQIRKKEKKSRHQVRKTREKLTEESRLGLVSIGLILFSVGLFFLTEAKPEIYQALVPRMLRYANGGLDFWASVGATAETGQLWRFFTPMFLHGGFLHLGFNMYFLYKLGGMLEKAHSPLWLLFTTLFFGAMGVFTEMAWSGSTAVGMSGVVYGLFSYAWIRGRYDPSWAYGVHRSTAMWLLVWYVLCFAGFMNIANGAHTAGLVLGCLWGLVRSGYLRRKYFR